MKGFTIVETLVAIVVFTLASGALMSFIVLSYRIYGYTYEQSVAIDEARKGVETMTREIRQAKQGDDGSYPIEKAEDKEFIFYSDIDNDGKTERVRYFLGEVSSGSSTKECVVFSKGGSCSVSFSNFLQGTIKTAQVQVSVEGDLGASNEYAEIFADGQKLGNLCQTQCSDCASTWQGTMTYDVTSQATDNSLQFLADATNQVDPVCSWQNPNHALKARFILSWTEELTGLSHEFKKGVTEPVGVPPTYPLGQEEVKNLSYYVRNAPPIFEYFDVNNNKIIIYPARLKDTKLMKVYLIINANPDRPPADFELESFVELRNLKTVQ
ncbi:MAG: hypothetical protein Q8N65_01055 [bacterium]|nr:hypothetical protein [bacterium]